MPTWKTVAATSRAPVVISTLLLCVSCETPDQGYWTKQPLPGEQYAVDSQHCDRFAAQNDGRESDKARHKRYMKCMSARGGLNPEVNQSITREDNSAQNPVNPSPYPSQSNEQRLVKDRECRQQAAATLSNPYAVYASCMQENRWSPPPALGAIADSAENEKPDSNTSHAQKDIGLQSPARNIGDENPKIASASGKMLTAESAEHETPGATEGHAKGEIALQSAARNIGDDNPRIASASAKMVTADSAEHETLDPSDPLERIGLDVQKGARNIGNVFSKIGSAIGRPLEAVGRGLQSAFSNIGDEIAEIGSRIGNLFKHLGGNDTRDKEKEKASNTRSPATER
jgi:hypothetical protein